MTPIYPQELQFVALNQHFYLSLCKLSLNIEHTYLCKFSFSSNCCCNSSRCVRKFSSRSSFSVHSSSFLLNFLWKFNTCWVLSISCSRNHASLVSVSSIFFSPPLLSFFFLCQLFLQVLYLLVFIFEPYFKRSFFLFQSSFHLFKLSLENFLSFFFLFLMQLLSRLLQFFLNVLYLLISFSKMLMQVTFFRLLVRHFVLQLLLHLFQISL